MRMVLRMLLLGAFTLYLAACYDDPPINDTQASSSPMAKTVGSGNPGQQRLALSHHFDIGLPKDAVERVHRKQADLCLKSDCSVLSSSVNRHDNGMTSASLSVRIAPAALDPFINSLSESPSHILSHSETADDKTVATLDIEARLNAKKALLGHLQDMQEKASAKGALSDLLAIEKELSQAQADIEAATSEYNYLHTLTETVKVDISYQSDYVREPEDKFRPIINAFYGIKEKLINSVAFLIIFTASIVPWLPFIALVIWGLRRLFRLRRKARGS